MTMIPDEIIEQVREAADIVEVIGAHVELRRTGADFRGPCPFHGGTHRNFAVIPKKGMFYCFVCHAGGDVFTFLMKRLGMDYPTAVREVARRVGITVPERGAAGPDPREPLFAAVAAAADWFAHQLRDAPEAESARRYLQSRGFDGEAAAVLGLGYAPRGGALRAAMNGLGVRDAVLVEAGLAVQKDDGSLAPRFWGRLLFPIHDLRGRVVGFGGRILGQGEPKYLNSPESAVFHKGQLLYNLNAAKLAIRRAERAILVEGYFDVLGLARVGLEEVVAPLGTGLTSDQAALLARYTKQALLLYDSDEAGLRATFRAGDELLRHGLRVAVATLPPAEDPDMVARRGGADAVERVLHDAVDLLERKIQILDRKGMFGSLPGRRRALDRLLPTIRAARDPITRELYLDRTAQATGVRKDVLEREVGEGGGTSGAGDPAAAGRAARDDRRRSLGSTLSAPGGAEKSLLLLLLAGGPWTARVRDAVDADDLEFPAYRTVFEAVVDDAPERLDDVAARVFEQLKEEGLAGRDPDALFAAAVDRIEARRLSRQIERIDRELPLAAEEDKLRLVIEKKRLSAEMNAKAPRYKSTRRSSASGS